MSKIKEKAGHRKDTEIAFNLINICLTSLIIREKLIKTIVGIISALH